MAIRHYRYRGATVVPYTALPNLEAYEATVDRSYLRPQARYMVAYLDREGDSGWYVPAAARGRQADMQAP